VGQPAILDQGKANRQVTNLTVFTVLNDKPDYVLTPSVAADVLFGITSPYRECRTNLHVCKRCGGVGNVCGHMLS